MIRQAEVLQLPFAGMTSAETSAPSLDPTFAESKGGALRRFVAPFAVGLALLSTFLTFVVLTGLTRIQPTPEVVVSFLLINDGHHSFAGRDHRAGGLAGDSSPPPRARGGEAARSDCKPVFDHRGVAGGAGVDRRQCDHRPRFRSAVFRPDPRGDPELGDHCPRVYAGTRAAHPWRHSGDGQRHIPRAAIIRSGSQIVP